MKSMNNTTGEHQALPEEMSTKNNKYNLVSSRSRSTLMIDFPTLS